MNLPSLEANKLFNTNDPKRLVTMVVIGVLVGVATSFLFPSLAWLGIFAAVAGVVIYNVLTQRG